MSNTTKNIYYISCIMLTITCATYSAEQQKKETTTSTALQMIEKPHIFTILLQDTNDIILDLLFINNCFNHFFEAANTINSLSRVNRLLNAYANNPTICLTLIKNWACKWKHMSHMHTARMLPINQAKQRVELQEKMRILLSTQRNDELTHYYLLKNQFEELWNQGVDLEFTYGENSECFLISAARKQTSTFTALILEKGINVNQADIHGRTALMIASLWKNKDTIECLLKDPRIAINQQDMYGETALLHSLGKFGPEAAPNPEIIKLLLNARADATIQKCNKRTALMTARCIGNQEIIALIENTLPKKE